jgi:hypothetical protein
LFEEQPIGLDVRDASAFLARSSNYAYPRPDSAVSLRRTNSRVITATKYVFAANAASKTISRVMTRDEY